MTALDETRTAAGEVAAADRTMVTATSLADSRTPRARGQQRRAVVARQSPAGRPTLAQRRARQRSGDGNGDGERRIRKI